MLFFHLEHQPPWIAECHPVSEKRRARYLISWAGRGLWFFWEGKDSCVIFVCKMHLMLWKQGVQQRDLRWFSDEKRTMTSQRRDVLRFHWSCSEVRACWLISLLGRVKQFRIWSVWISYCWAFGKRYNTRYNHQNKFIGEAILCCCCFNSYFGICNFSPL
jgi:hypothetical protein